jgi:hypothetical protein
MILEYISDKGFILGTTTFNWGESRELIREKLKNRHEQDDDILDMAQSVSKDLNHNIERRRDIYEDLENEENYFFLSYDHINGLKELEVHWGIRVHVDNVEMEFEKDINIYLKQLKSKGHEYKELEQGNYIFKDLKFTIADSASMGGDGNALSYFYAGENIEHLIEE